MQEALGLWHDYVVLTERTMQMSLEALLPHHDAELQARVLGLVRLLLRRSSMHLKQFSELWAKGGGDVAAAVRRRFRSRRWSVSESKTDRDPPGSDGSASPATPPTDALSAAQG